MSRRDDPGDGMAEYFQAAANVKGHTDASPGEFCYVFSNDQYSAVTMFDFLQIH